MHVVVPKPLHTFGRHALILAGLAVLFADDAEVLRLRALYRRQEPFSRKATPQQLAHRRSAAWHALVVAPVFHCRQLIFIEHDLQTFTAFQSSHSSPQYATDPTPNAG